VSKTENEALIENLSESDKDELVLRLWRDLQNERAHVKALEQRLAQLDGTEPAASPLLKKLQAASIGGDRGTSPAAVRPGRRRRDCFRSRLCDRQVSILPHGSEPVCRAAIAACCL
jgi:hypothetical protein